MAESGGIQYLIFECLAERTIAIAQQAKMRDASLGYDPLLVDRMQAVLGVCAANGIKIVTNMGAANPVAGAHKISEVARALGLRNLKIAGVKFGEIRYDLIGSNAIHGAELSKPECDPYEVRIRVAGRTDSMKEAARIANEVEALYTSGPAGGGGAWKSTREVVAMLSALVPRNLVRHAVHYIES